MQLLSYQIIIGEDLTVNPRTLKFLFQIFYNSKELSCT